MMNVPGVIRSCDGAKLIAHDRGTHPTSEEVVSDSHRGSFRDFRDFRGS
jgi:hypothetical protein